MEKYGRTTAVSGTPSSTCKCPVCRDTGFVEIDPERRIWQRCSCLKIRAAEKKLAASGLAEAAGEMTFDSFETKTPLQERLKKTGTDYLAAVLESAGKPRRPWLYIGGNPGSGKTHICTAVCGALLKNNVAVRYMQWLSEIRRLKAVANSECFEDAVREYLDVEVLYIDDLLKQRYTPEPEFSEADVKIAFTILNSRYLTNRPTIISSEWSLLDHLLPADEGVFSRVYERCRGFMVCVSRDRRNNYRMTGNDRSR